MVLKRINVCYVKYCEVNLRRLTLLSVYNIFYDIFNYGKNQYLIR